ncbi:MAG TPA: MotA/TolQ/ExbB proton channel family protein [Opitutaceae bacterium]
MLLATLDLARVIREAGYLIYPLGLCSAAAIFIIFERAYALRPSAIVPEDLAEAVIEGRTPSGDKRSTLGRILNFAERHVGDSEATKAYARLEVIRMERGVRYLDIIYAAAPLIGLIGTVTGLLGAFSVVDPNTKMPDPVVFTESVGYALSATVLGLVIALPALVGSGYLNRVVEKRVAQLDVLLERVLARQGAAPASAPLTRV